MNDRESTNIDARKHAPNALLLEALGILGILGTSMLGACDPEPEACNDEDLVFRDSESLGPDDELHQASLGRGTTCSSTLAGEVKCWGRNEHGQLGQGHRDTLGDDETPDSFSFVALGSPIAEVQTNGEQTFVRTIDGRIHAWGANHAHELGLTHALELGDDETPASASVTTEVQTGGVAVQLVVGQGFACVRLEDGGVRCWGTNEHGQLGQGHTERVGDDETPRQVPAIELGAAAVDIAAGAQHACAVLRGGSVRCWGRGREGQLGHGDLESIGDDERPTDVGEVDVGEVDVGAAVVDIVAGGMHTCALLDSGSVRCWGRGQEGQLGRGDVETIGDDEPPAQAGDVLLGEPVVSLAAGSMHTCAVLETGALHCWGSGEHGQLGLGSTETIGDDEAPAVAGVVDLGQQRASAVFSGPLSSSTCVLLDGEHLRCWGDNDVGQLGYGTTLRLGDEPQEGGGDLPDVIVIDDDG